MPSLLNPLQLFLSLAMTKQNSGLWTSVALEKGKWINEEKFPFKLCDTHALGRVLMEMDIWLIWSSQAARQGTRVPLSCLMVLYSPSCPNTSFMHSRLGPWLLPPWKLSYLCYSTSINKLVMHLKVSNIILSLWCTSKRLSKNSFVALTKRQTSTFSFHS